MVLAMLRKGVLAKSIGKHIKKAFGFGASRGDVNAALDRLASLGLAHVSRVDLHGRKRWTTDSDSAAATIDAAQAEGSHAGQARSRQPQAVPVAAATTALLSAALADPGQ